MYTTICMVEVAIVHQYYIKCICHIYKKDKKKNPLRLIDWLIDTIFCNNVRYIVDK